MESFLGYVATGVISFMVGALLMYFRPKAKLVYWSPHSFLFNLTQQRVALQTDALTMQNLGSTAAHNVDIVLNDRPDFFQFAPAIPYQENTLDNGQFALRINELGPKEFVTLQLLSYTKVPQLLNIRSDAGHAQAIQIQLQRIFPKWVNIAVLILMLIGAATLIYGIALGLYRFFL